MIKIKVEISDGEGNRKGLSFTFDVKSRDKVINLVERFMWCGITEMEKSNSGLTV